MLHVGQPIGMNCPHSTRGFVAELRPGCSAQHGRWSSQAEARFQLKFAIEMLIVSRSICDHICDEELPLRFLYTTAYFFLFRLFAVTICDNVNTLTLCMQCEMPLCKLNFNCIIYVLRCRSQGVFHLVIRLFEGGEASNRGRCWRTMKWCMYRYWIHFSYCWISHPFCTRWVLKPNIFLFLASSKIR